MISSTDTEDNVRELTEALRQLNLAQGRVNTVLDRIRRKSNRTEESASRRRARAPIRQPHRSRQQDNFHTNPQQDYQYVLPNSNIRVGDRVQILNPGPLQQDRGIVVGPARRRGFILIRTGNGDIILRIPRNLKQLSNVTEIPDIY